MHDERTALVHITRNANDTIGGVRRTGRVYITGPHIGNTYSSTEDRSRAGVYSREEAETMIEGGKWRSSNPEIVDA